VVAATHRDLLAMIHQGTFREDLYYRLHIFPLTVPPLRERRDDIPVLVRHFAQQYAHQMHKHIAHLPAEAMAGLVHYDWPGNVRELQNVIERAVILSSNGVLCPQVPARSTSVCGSAAVSPKSATLDDMMRAHILDALRCARHLFAASQNTINGTETLFPRTRNGTNTPAIVPSLTLTAGRRMRKPSTPTKARTRCNI